LPPEEQLEENRLPELRKQSRRRIKDLREARCKEYTLGVKPDHMQTRRPTRCYQGTGCEYRPTDEKKMSDLLDFFITKTKTISQKRATQNW
jgi:hypothetical protein